jgi:hypothetical protein
MLKIAIFAIMLVIGIGEYAGHRINELASHNFLAASTSSR